MTYGQLSVMRSMGGLTGAHQRDANVVCAWEVPDGATVTRVTAAWDRLVEADESLRTVFGLADGRPLQYVCPPQPRELEVMQLSAVTEESALALARELAAEPFRPDIAPPVRPVVLMDGSRPRYLASVMHHICVDGIAREVLERQFRAVLAGGRIQQETQPLAMAREQRAATGTRERRVTYWARVWDGLEPPNHLGPDTSPRLMVTLHSRSALTAAALIAGRYGVSVQAVILTMTAVALAGLNQRDSVSLALVAANRYGPRWANAVTSLNQFVPVTVDVDRDGALPDVVRTIFMSSLEAYRNGMFDVDELTRRLVANGHDHPEPLHFEVLFNFLGEIGAACPPGSPAAHSVEWGFSGRTTGPRLALYAAVGEGLLISARVSPSYLPDDTPGLLLASIEALLLGLARDWPGNLRELGRGAPLRPYARPA